ncbi:LamG-like jellyroll fold domain-containing protein [Kitasatospora sp. NPDC002040]|uniref:LamG-like jellyroll fold domain-containing protein n=1 Tax=Kitasatospora sp. NPDC002040 TaxID=3154661 RepID=UPI003317B297
MNRESETGKMRIRGCFGLPIGGAAGLLAGVVTATALSGAPTLASAQSVPNGAAVSAGSATVLTEQQASVQAKAAGKPVVATALTTETSQTAVNPNGTLTLTQSAVPVRTFRDGAWTGLDATLRVNPDGTLSPAVTPSSVVLSGGGTGPLAALHNAGQGLTLTLPAALPKPQISGNSALYPEVLPGVDLTVTVRESGAISDVFTVKNKQAAHDPRLADLLSTKAVTTAGLKTEADADGNIAVTDQHGRPVYTSPAPIAWDSTPLADAAKPAAAENLSALQPKSATAAPGRAANQAKLKPTVKPGAINLAVPTELLDAAATVYPVFLDPTYSPNWGSNAYSSPSSAYPNTKYWNNTVDPTAGITQIGNSGIGEALSLFNFPIDRNLLSGATIFGAYFGITETRTWACLTNGHNQSVDLYAPTPTLDSTNASWNYWSTNLGGIAAGPTRFAYGYSGCAAQPIPAFNVTGAVNNALNAGKWTQTIALRADDHSDNYAFKEFQASTANLTITYDKTPNTPTGLYTSPATNCADTILGDTSVTLYAPVSTPTSSSLTTTFSLYKTADASHINQLTPANGINSNAYTGASGQPAVMPVPEALFKAVSGGAAMSFTWQAITSDGTLNSTWSAQCSFTWDPTRPGKPQVTVNASPPNGSSSCPTVGQSGPLPQVGTVCSFKLAPPTGSSALSGYLYQLNQNPAITISTTGSTVINVRLEHLVNTLTVTALSAGSNLGDPETVWFNGSAINPPAKDGDLTNDGTPDLVVPGGSGTLPSGLWLSPGQPGGGVAASATNIGLNGLAFNTAGTSADWNGAQTITGNFCGNGAQDVLAYFPDPANANTGGGSITCNDGSTNPLRTTLGNTNAPLRIPKSSLIAADRSPAARVANAGNTSNKSTGHPDLLAISGSQLALHWSTTPNGYTNTDPDWGGICISGGTCTVLTGLNTPDGSQNWNEWTPVTTQLANGTAMFLWKPSTGALKLWTGLKLSTDGTTLTTAGKYTLAGSGWNTGRTLQLRAADINGTGIPGLWVTDRATGQTTAYQPAALADTPAAAGQVTSVNTPSRSWDFQDIGANATGSPLASTADTVAGSAMTGTTGVRWGNSGPFTPNAALNEGSGPATAGALQTAGPAVNLSGQFSVSVWTKPADWGVTLSQDGNHSSGFLLYPDGATGQWYFCLATGDTIAWSYDCASGGSVKLGAWTNIVGTYNAASGLMTIYVNGVEVGRYQHGAVDSSQFRQPLTVGNYIYNNGRSSPYKGAVARIRTWDSALSPLAVAGLGTDPNTTLFAPDGTLYPSGSVWTHGTNTLSFDRGRMTVSVAGTPLYQVGNTSYPNAVMTFQADGNLVCYPTAADAKTRTNALWATVTAGNPGAALLMQADGNLVLYAADGTPKWWSATSFAGSDQWPLSSSAGGGDTAATNPATRLGGASWGTDHRGTVNAAAVFDGADDQFRTNAAAVDTRGSYTVAAWVKLNNTNWYQTFVTQNGGQRGAFYLQYSYAYGSWAFVAPDRDYLDTGTYYAASSPTAPALNTWTHLVGTYDATSHTMSLYVNGTLVGTANNPTPWNATGPVTIGAASTSQYPPDSFVNGSISDVRILPAALNATQVAAMYSS